jgi:hypothetical protein
MTAPLTQTTAKVQASKALKLSWEGIIAGTCGAATMTLWFLLLDVWAGHPLSTPHIPTVSLDVISLVASSCGYYRGQIEQRAAQ